MSEPPARRSAQLTARIAAFVALLASGYFTATSVLVAPMPWPWIFGLVWLGFVVATILLAFRWPYRALGAALMSVAVVLIALWIGQSMLDWGP
jgi:hypothetical protein